MHPKGICSPRGVLAQRRHRVRHLVFRGGVAAVTQAVMYTGLYPLVPKEGYWWVWGMGVGVGGGHGFQTEWL